ncbi:replication initiation protein [Thermomonas sp.]|uniref:rolling circle replication-associated protein n=1 Tax=Thermomonas sp. TaxID=1971895 RepID=UPI0035B3B8EB
MTTRDNLLEAAARRREDANRVLAPGIPWSSKGSREAATLGLVPSSTSGHGLQRVAITLDQARIRAMRLRKSIITGSRLHDQEAREGSIRGAWYMLTTTYREGSNSSPRDVSDLVRSVRRYFNRIAERKHRANRPRFRYLWVGELTKRLRPHYHLLIWIPRGFWLPKADQTGWWPHGSTKIEKARNAVGYLAKYASKFTGAMAEAFPKGFRTHAIGGLGEESKRELRWWKAPTDARNALGPHADIRKVQGGYADKHTGSFWPSPWRCFFDKGRVIAWKLEPIT